MTDDLNDIINEVRLYARSPIRGEIPDAYLLALCAVAEQTEAIRAERDRLKALVEPFTAVPIQRVYGDIAT